MIAIRSTRTASARRLIGAGSLVLCAGCFKLARPTPPLEEYVLGARAHVATIASAGAMGGLTIGLRRLDLAPYLATPAIVVRQGSRVISSNFRRWAEEPSAGIMRAVASSLLAAPSIQAVDVAPWSVRTRHDYLIQLHISQLEGVMSDDVSATDGEVRVMASWEIVRPATGALIARGETDRTATGWKVGDYADLVTRVHEGLAGLAGDMVACLARLDSVSPAPADTTATPVVMCGAR